MPAPAARPRMDAPAPDRARRVPRRGSALPRRWRRRSPTGPRPWSSRPCSSFRLRFACSMRRAGVSRVPISCTVRPRSPRTCAISCSSRPTSAASFGVGVAIAASLWCPPGRRRTRSENAGPSRTADVEPQSKEHASRALRRRVGRGSQLAVSRCRDRVWHEGHADHTRRRGRFIMKNTHHWQWAATLCSGIALCGTLAAQTPPPSNPPSSRRPPHRAASRPRHRAASQRRAHRAASRPLLRRATWPGR